MNERDRAVVKRADHVERREVVAGTATETQVLLGPDDGAPNFAMRRFIMGEGGGMPRHTNSVEHEQYVLSGRAKLGLGDDVVEVGQGDVVFVPAGVAHWYRAEGDVPFEVLCLVPKGADQLEILEEGVAEYIEFIRKHNKSIIR